MKLHVSRLLSYITLILALVACGGIGDTLDPNALLELTPLPTSIVQGNCDDVAILEDWIQTMIFNQVEFETFLANAQDKSRVQLYRELTTLNTIAYTVASTPILPCGEEAYRLTLSAMENTLITMQAYVNAERHDIATVIIQAKRNFEDAYPAQNTLVALLDALYQQRANP